MYAKKIGTNHRVDLDRVISVRGFCENDYLEQREHFANFSSVENPKSVVTMDCGIEFVSDYSSKTICEALNKRRRYFDGMSRLYMQ